MLRHFDIIIKISGNKSTVGIIFPYIIKQNSFYFEKNISLFLNNI